MKWSMSACRTNTGKSREDMAKFVGVTADTIGKWERGVTSPNIKYAPKIIEFYRINGLNIGINDIDFLRQKGT